ncbi:hypothetical protein P9578_03575 [Brevibacillus choshinensis]|uniref:hypothetical protein n=1 Tax=Brevibacillus choshinensis TaxID=54911 RepID=UPI002E21CD5F|nr:hypothetical protein [Brevibacillus choshinensis]
MNDPEIFAEPCAMCRKRKATQLCDYIIEYRSNPIFFRNYEAFQDSIKFCNDETCDLPLCKECSQEMNGADLCPHHYELQQQAELPEHLRRAQTQSKVKLWS